MGTEEMHKKANLHRLYYRGEQHLLNYAFGLKKDDDNVDKRSIPTRGRRRVCLNIPKLKSNGYYRSFRYRVIDKWNKVDPNLTTINNQIMLSRR